jgi:hypothetical protein
MTTGKNIQLPFLDSWSKSWNKIKFGMAGYICRFVVPYLQPIYLPMQNIHFSYKLEIPKHLDNILVLIADF